MKHVSHLIPLLAGLAGPPILAALLRGHWFIIFLIGVVAGAASLAALLFPREKPWRPSQNVRDPRWTFFSAAAFAAMCDAGLLWIAFVEEDLDHLRPSQASSLVFLPGMVLAVIVFLIWAGCKSPSKAQRGV